MGQTIFGLLVKKVNFHLVGAVSVYNSEEKICLLHAPQFEKTGFWVWILSKI